MESLPTTLGGSPTGHQTSSMSRITIECPDVAHTVCGLNCRGAETPACRGTPGECHQLPSTSGIGTGATGRPAVPSSMGVSVGGGPNQDPPVAGSVSIQDDPPTSLPSPLLGGSLAESLFPEDKLTILFVAAPQVVQVQLPKTTTIPLA